MIVESPLQLIFRDLFYRLPAFAGRHDVFLKLEGFNITGSIKVKTAMGLVEDLERRGIARPNETVLVESSSGNLGLALSLICAIKGYKFICVTDPNANRATLRGMELYGAKVIVVEDRDSAGGYLGSRLEKIDQILQSEPNAVWLNQYANIANKNVHAEQTANEIAREFDKVDWVFVGTGTTGTLAGISERLRDRKSTRLNSSHLGISYAVFCLKKKKKQRKWPHRRPSPAIVRSCRNSSRSAESYAKRHRTPY